jgi:hypothetical protein
MTKPTISLPHALMPKVALLATMPPLPDESCASWIQRMGGSHQYSMAKLMQILGFRASRRDWDLPIPLAAWLQILAVTGIFHPKHGHSPRVLSILTTYLEPARLLLHSTGRPRYRWCGRCLASDPVPYLRWHWRLRMVETCEVHRVALRQVCPWCSEPLWMDSCRLVAFGAHGLALDLAHCDRCGMPLHDEREQSRARAGRGDKLVRNSLSLFQNPWTNPDAGRIEQEVMLFANATGLQGAIWRRVLAHPGSGTDVVVSRLPIRTSGDIIAAHARASANATRLRSAQDRAKRWTLNALSFRATESLALGASTPIVRWSWHLNGEDRLEIARALRAIREEKRKGAEQEPIK